MGSPSPCIYAEFSGAFLAPRDIPPSDAPKGQNALAQGNAWVNDKNLPSPEGVQHPICAPQEIGHLSHKNAANLVSTRNSK